MKVSVSALVAFCLSSSVDAFTMPSASGRMSVSVSSSTAEKAVAEESAPAADDSATREKFEKLLETDDAVKEEAPVAVEDPNLDPLKRVQV